MSSILVRTTYFKIKNNQKPVNQMITGFVFLAKTPKYASFFTTLVSFRAFFDGLLINSPKVPYCADNQDVQ